MIDGSGDHAQKSSRNCKLRADSLLESIEMPKLTGKVAVITGATSGMALATAKLGLGKLDEPLGSINERASAIRTSGADV